MAMKKNGIYELNAMGLAMEHLLRQRALIEMS